MKIKRTYKVCLLIAASVAVIHTACKKYDADYAKTNPDSEWLSGGLQTVYDQSSAAFSHAFPVLSENLERVHEIGDVQFEATFVSAPAPVNPGRGPIFNNVSCSSCHIADGRGKVPGSGDTSVLMLFRISIAGENAHGGPNPVPGFGDQIQNRSTLGIAKEADVTIAYTEQAFAFDDGTPYKLRFPAYTVTNTYTAFPGDVMLSPRVAAPVFGLGLLEAVSDADVLAKADENDANADGISGKPNFVWNAVTKTTTLGRFGWKANQPSLLQQVAAAYNGDIGVTTSIFPVESSFGQPQYDNRDDDYELSDSLLHAVEFYVKTLAVPVRRNADNPVVKNGKQLFINAGCASCHIPDMRTSVNVAFPAVSNQLIHPYTDLLLHDMGDDLADNRPDFKATGKEWRTAPLWGIGLTQKVNGHNNFLHDGRARSLLEAIMWHGGEAATAKNKVKAMSADERSSLIKFLESL
ncbi:MAG: c-type cytochrome [Chitinophagaceae bacterium]|nr:c-type cytochrome [Chitinophagaceae bacterium]